MGGAGGTSLLDEVMGALPHQSQSYQPHQQQQPHPQPHHQRRALPPTPSSAALPQPYHRPVPLPQGPGDVGLPGYHSSAATSQRSSYASLQRGSTGSGEIAT